MSDSDVKEKLDANKRRSLPAWIRDGLEKMEKEKLKNVGKSKINIGCPDNLQSSKDISNYLLQENLMTQKSKFVSLYLIK